LIDWLIVVPDGWMYGLIVLYQVHPISLSAQTNYLQKARPKQRAMWSGISDMK
jgi:hypothetical protein